MGDIIEKLEAWIEKGGFPLEMKVSNAFIKAGFEVAQSVYYMDIESDKYRETDIIASKYKQVNGIWVNLTFVVECKSSLDKPWVILINKGLKNQSSGGLPTYITHNGIKFLKATSLKEDYKSDLLFKNDRSIGYSMQTAFNSGKDKSYEAIQSVTKACEYFLQECNKKRKNQCNFYFPVIIVDGKLFNAALTENGEMEIEKVEQTELLVTRSFHSYGNANILIFDVSDIDKIVMHINNMCDELFDNYSDLLEHKIQKV